MRTIFIADAHLVSSEDNNYRRLLCFLHELEGNLDTLYVMGDLFDFWIGFPSNNYPQYDEIIETLERLVAHGCRLVYFEGNHDFHLGSIFSQRLKAEIHTGPTIKCIQGKRIYICHGDQINKEDYLYRLLRFLLHSRLVAASVRYFPPLWAQLIRSILQRKSQASYVVKKTRWNYRQILMGFSQRLQNDGLDALVTGHFHIALCEDLPESTFSILSLGDWMEQFTYGEILDGKLQLITYAEPE